MRGLIVTIIVFALLPVIAMRPYIGVYVWSWLGYMNPHRLSYGFAFTMPFSAIVAAALFIGLFFNREPKKFPWTPSTIVLLIFVGWMCVTTVFALHPEAAFMEWKRSMKIQLMVIITLLLINDKKKVEWLIITIVFSIGFFGIKGGLFAIATGGSYRVWGPPDTFIQDNNALALALIMILPLMRYLQLRMEIKWKKVLMGIGMLLCAASIVSSYSRGAFLAGSMITLFMIMKSRKRVLLLGAVILMIPIAISFIPSKWFNRMATIEDYQEDGSALGRINAWHFAFNLAVDRPLVGGGFQSFKKDSFKIYAPEPDNFHDAHSIYFEALGEQGFVGLSLFLLLGTLTWRLGTKIIRQTKGNEELVWAHDMASMVQVSILGYAVGGAFLGLAYYDLYYHLVAIMVIISKIVEGSLKQVSEEQNPLPAMSVRRVNGISHAPGQYQHHSNGSRNSSNRL